MPFSTQRIEELRGECENTRYIGQKDNPDFTNSWVNHGAGLEATGFYKDKFNRVWLSGSIKNGTVDSTSPFSPAFTVPAGYRPTLQLRYSTTDGTGVPNGQIMIDTNGDVNILTGNNALITLDGISWRV